VLSVPRGSRAHAWRGAARSVFGHRAVRLLGARHGSGVERAQRGAQGTGQVLRCRGRGARVEKGVGLGVAGRGALGRVHGWRDPQRRRSAGSQGRQGERGGMDGEREEGGRR
jgi:hypothetical protein